MALSVTAKQRTITEMRSIAVETMKIQFGLAMDEKDEFERIKETDQLCIMSSRNGGTVIIAKDYQNPAVLGYSSLAYDKQQVPCGFSWWLAAIDHALNTQAGTVNHSRNRSVPKRFPSNVSPILQCNWGQRYPYNQMCPGNALVGCVAVAMGQVMSAHGYPNRGQGKHSYDCNYGMQFVDYGNTTYDWELIRANDYGEISKLLYHCGVSVNMDYGLTASLASSSMVRDALIGNFRYKLSAKHLKRNEYTTESWMSILFENLANGCPVYYAGDQSNDIGAIGHAFVIDGYNSSGYVHVNWGWNGDMNGFYDLATLGNTYPYNQEMICDIIADENIQLTLGLGGGGLIKLMSNYAQSYEFSFVPVEGYYIREVIFNGTDVTAQLSNGNTFVTPIINLNSSLEVKALSICEGDVNDDGVVDIADVNILINLMLGKEETRATPETADVTGDGVVDIADLNAVINAMLGK